MTDFETQLSELLLLLTLEQKEAARDLLLLLTEGVGANCRRGKDVEE